MKSKSVNREYWIDYIKVLACILVVLGHFFQSMTKAGILPDTDFLQWFDQTIYYFHVPLFFICSGYVYNKYKTVNNIVSWADNLKRKLWDLGIPYLVFSLLTWLLKFVFSSSVNTQNEGLLSTLFVTPASPYWFLYILFFVFFITPTGTGRKLYDRLLLAVLMKCIAFTGVFENIYLLNRLFANEIWFVSGMVLSTIDLSTYLNKKKGMILGISGCAAFLLISVPVYLACWSLELVYFLLGALACTSIVVFYYAVYSDNEKKDSLHGKLSRYTMPVFLMHTLWASTVRIVLVKLGVSNAVVHVLLGLFVSFAGPVLITACSRKFKILELVIFPGKYYSIFCGRISMTKKHDDSSQLKIAMYGHKSIPSRKGGVEVVVSELGKRMVQRGYDITCYNRKNKKEKRMPGDVYEGIHLKYVFTINKKGLAALTSSIFAGIRVAFSHADLVHVHAEGPAATCWIPKLFGKKVVVTVHGLDWQRDKWGGFASWYIRLGEKNAVKYADEIIVLSNHVQQYFMDTYGRKTLFVPNGVNRPILTEAELINQTHGLVKDGYILFLSRLVPEKGLESLIHAYKKVNTNLKLVIVGGSSDTDQYAERMKQLASDDPRILFTGYVEGQMLHELYSNAYLYVLPSNLEGMPLSLLEAMSYGNCCLVSDIDECVEVVGEHAVTFHCGDEQDLQKTLQQLCDSPERVAVYKEQAQNYICEKYDWEAITDKTLEIYKSI